MRLEIHWPVWHTSRMTGKLCEQRKHKPYEIKPKTGVAACGQPSEWTLAAKRKYVFNKDDLHCSPIQRLRSASLTMDSRKQAKYKMHNFICTIMQPEILRLLCKNKNQHMNPQIMGGGTKLHIQPGQNKWYIFHQKILRYSRISPSSSSSSTPRIYKTLLHLRDRWDGLSECWEKS